MKKILFICQVPEREANWILNYDMLYSKKKELDVIIFSHLDEALLKREKKSKNKKNIYNYLKYSKSYQEKYERISNEEIALKKKELEKKYNIPFSFIEKADRYIMNKTQVEIDRNMVILTEFLIDKVFESREYIKIVGEMASTFNLICYFLCKKYGLEYLFFWHGRMKNKIAIDDLEGNRKGLKEKFNDLKERDLTFEEKEILKKYYEEIEYSITPIYEKLNRKIDNPYNWLRLYAKSKLIKLYYEILTYSKDKKYALLRPKKIRERLKDFIKILTLNLKRKRVDFDKVEKNEKYLLFPLHVQPEVTTLVFAQEYVDQIKTALEIAKNLPNNYFLYVKEHPSMFKFRKLKEYEELKKNSKIKLISPEESIKNLILFSEGVITLTGTAGYEAILLNKPVYLLGKVFYQLYPNVYKVENLKELSKFILFPKKEISSQIKDAFILANILSLKEGNYNNYLLDKDVTSDENAKKIAKIIYEG